PRRRARLYVMHLPAERIRHVPVVGRRVARNARAALHILAHDLAVPTDIRADRTAGYCAAGRRDVAPAATANLMAENTTNHRARNRAVDIRLASGDFLALDPATLLGRSDHGAPLRDPRFEDSVTFMASIVIVLSV